MRPIDRFKMNRIAIIVASMNGGGAERSILTLAKYLAEESEFEIDIVIRNFRGPLLREIPEAVNVCVVDRDFYVSQDVGGEEYKGFAHAPTEVKVFLSKRIGVIDFVRYVIPNWPLGVQVVPRRNNRYVTSANSLVKYINARQPSVIMTALPNDLACTMIAVKIGKFSIPVISSVRDHINKKHPRSHKILSNLLHKATRVHVISKGLKSDLKNYVFESERVFSIYNIAARPEIKTLSREPVNHEWMNKDAKNLKVVLSVGRLARQKNYHMLIEAFAKVRLEYEEARLIIIGEGEERKALESHISKLALTDSVSLLGWLKNPYPYMFNCDVFALSSDHEGLGNVLIEALICECNIVSTDCSHGPAEILKNGSFGALVPTGDKNAMANAIKNAFANKPDLSKLNRRASQFSWEKLGPEYLALFEELIEKPA